MRVQQRSNIRRAAAVFLAALAFARGQGAGLLPAVQPPAPLAPAPAALSSGSLSVALASAQRAHDLGFLSVAAAAYRELIDIPGAHQRGAAMSLATVLLDAAQPAEAERVLATLAEPRDAAWRLRAGLAALQLKRRDAAQAQWDAIRAEDIPEADRPWYHFFTGALYDSATPRDEKRANEHYLNAERGAPNELARARFQLAAERVRLRFGGPPSKDTLDAVKRLYDQWQGREPSYGPARDYAVMLALLNRSSEAVRFLREQVLLSLPPQERAWRDEFNFLVGLLGDVSRGGFGRNALTQLVANGTKRERQRQALQILSDKSKAEPERTHFRVELERWLTATPSHPLRELLLFFRAELALSEKDYAAAEANARRLVDEYPGSPVRLHALGILTQSAWEQARYRLAAANASAARAVLGAPAATAGAGGANQGVFAVSAERAAEIRAELGVLEAEAWFRLGEFRNAADAYAAVLREQPPKERLSALIFQRLLAEIQAGSAAAPALIDEFAANAGFNVNDRWQVEWSLARKLQLEGKVEQAYARVSSLLGVQRVEQGGAMLRPDLRARIGWLHAKLAYEAERYEAAIAHVDELLKAPGDLESNLRNEILSTALLLRAEAELKLGREPVAFGTLKRLREEFTSSDAAVQSYLIESDYFAQQGKISEAQLRLTSLTDNPVHAKNPNLPYALFQLALLSERLGQDKDLAEANRRLEELMKLESARQQPDLIFTARMRQGEIFQRRSDFAAAQQAYEFLVNNFPRRPDVVIAQLRLADCHNAQSSADPSHADSAQALYEALRDSVNAPADVRVEAGYKLGILLMRKKQTTRAASVWWKDVIDPFLVNNQQPFGAGDKRPYWLGRTLLALGKLYEDQENVEEARKWYAMILESGLGTGDVPAREALKRLGVADVKL
jgi:TolA-binding protein